MLQRSYRIVFHAVSPLRWLFRKRKFGHHVIITYSILSIAKSWCHVIPSSCTGTLYSHRMRMMMQPNFKLLNDYMYIILQFLTYLYPSPIGVIHRSYEHMMKKYHHLDNHLLSPTRYKRLSSSYQSFLTNLSTSADENAAAKLQTIYHIHITWKLLQCITPNMPNPSRNFPPITVIILQLMMSFIFYIFSKLYIDISLFQLWIAH